MAIFKVPRITTIDRTGLLLQVGEIVYDIDSNVFYGGDGVSLGGFPIGSNSGYRFERKQITAQNIIDKYITLDATPAIPDVVIVDMENGIKQINGVDFEVIGNKISWDGLGLDGFIDDTDILLIQY